VITTNPMDKTVNPEDVIDFLEEFPFKILWCWKSDYRKMYQLGIFTGVELKKQIIGISEKHFVNQEASIIMLCGEFTIRGEIESNYEISRCGAYF
jgi:hypothetical protein